MSSKLTGSRRTGLTTTNPNLTYGGNRRHGSHSATAGLSPVSRDLCQRQSQSSKGDRNKQKLKLPPVTISNLDSDFELEGSAMRVPLRQSSPMREEKRPTIHVQLVETGSNASHTEDLHSFCELQLRDAKEREASWRKLKVTTERENVDLKQSLQEKMEELGMANGKLDKLSVAHNEVVKAHKSSKDEIESLKEKLSNRVKRVDEMFLAHQKEIATIKNDHHKELSIRDEKLELLKCQLEKMMDEKSWERQKQLDELSKELGRVTEETEILKTALKTKMKR